MSHRFLSVCIRVHRWLVSAFALRSGPTNGYNLAMKSATTASALERLVGLLGGCLTPESARRLLALKADRKLQARVDYLAERCKEGLLTPDQRAEYSNYVTFGTFVAILKSQARQLLANPQGE